MRLYPLVFVVGCETIDPPGEAPTLIPPDAPAVEAIRTASVVHEPPAPAAAPRSQLREDLVGMHGPTKRWFLALTAQQRHEAREICRIREANPCAGMMPTKQSVDGEPVEEPIDRLLASFQGADNDHVDNLCREMNNSICDTPLVLAFDDRPIVFTPATHERFAFDPGFPVATDWPTEATPWIAIDRDGDGAITNGAELFGDSTPLAGRTARNGFEALAALDANGDGTLDRHDPAFASLLLWSDANADRRSTPDELRPLAAAVDAIPLAYRVDPRCSDGNCEGERGVAHLRGGRTGAVIDIYLRSR